MTDTPAAATSATPIPAGWYADSMTPGLMRWWDGAAWTEHTAAAASVAPYAAAAASVAPYAAGGERPKLPADRPIYSPFIWVIVLLPLLTYGLFFSWQPDFSAMTGAASSGSYNPTAIYGAMLTPGYFLILASGWLIWGLTALLAFRDRVWLERQGVVRPFHWAWAFLGGLVYVIGRTVIVRRVAAPRGMAPIWVLIGVFVTGIAVTLAWTALLTTQIVSQLPSYGG
ncbi:MAG: DUF2510 domain-containing protein [Actinomycetota bacterium]|nr:DUF2510 domain-containing protein [Actinomycetota bacterium]